MKSLSSWESAMKWLNEYPNSFTLWMLITLSWSISNFKFITLAIYTVLWGWQSPLSLHFNIWMRNSCNLHSFMKLTVAIPNPFHSFNSQVLQFTRFYEVSSHHSQSVWDFIKTDSILQHFARVIFTTPTPFGHFWKTCSHENKAVYAEVVKSLQIFPISFSQYDTDKDKNIVLTSKMYCNS